MDKIVLKTSSLEVIEELNMKQRGELLTAIFDLYAGNPEAELSQIMKIVFSPFKKQFELDFEKYEKQRVTNKANALKKYADMPKNTIREDAHQVGQILDEMLPGASALLTDEIAPKKEEKPIDQTPKPETISEPKPETEPKAEGKIIKNTKTENEFLELFNRLKKASQPNSTGHTTLSEPAKRNLKRLLAKGHTFEELECAISAMLVNEWVIRTNNDMPEHILREEVFKRNLLAYEKEKDKPKFELTNETKLIDDENKADEIK